MYNSRLKVYSTCLILILLIGSAVCATKKKASKKATKAPEPTPTTPSATPVDEVALATKWQQLMALREESGDLHTLRLDSASLKQVATTGPRNYTLLLYFTSNTEQYPCEPCVGMQQELNKVVAEYQKQHGKRDNLYFATVDIVDVQDLIEQLRKRVPNIPSLIHLPPTTESGKQFKFQTRDVYTFTGEDSAATLAQFINSVAKTNIKIAENRLKLSGWRLYLIGFGMLIGLVLLATYQYAPEKTRNRAPLLFFNLTCVLYFVILSGIIYNSIHNPPKYHTDQRGNIWLFMPNLRSHFQVEGYIIGALSLAISIAVILLNEWTPKIQDSGKAWSYFLVLLFLAVGCFAFVLQVFKMKAPYYPYALPLAGRR
jgi:thiol-disulfide isomerase/thioredoxin